MNGLEGRFAALGGFDQFRTHQSGIAVYDVRSDFPEWRHAVNGIAQQRDMRSRPCRNPPRSPGGFATISALLAGVSCGGHEEWSFPQGGSGHFGGNAAPSSLIQRLAGDAGAAEEGAAGKN